MYLADIDLPRPHDHLHPRFKALVNDVEKVMTTPDITMWAPWKPTNRPLVRPLGPLRACAPCPEFLWVDQRSVGADA